MHLTSAQVDELKNRALAMQNRLRRMADNVKKSEAIAIGAIEVGGAAFAAGVIEGRYSDMHIMGMQPSLVGAIAMHGAGLAGFAPEHMHNLGNGSLAAYLHGVGTGVGAQMAVKAHG
jgi:hypothetical protein